MIVTRKIKLRVVTDNDTEKAEIWAYLRQLDETVFVAANHIINFQYYNELANENAISNESWKLNDEIMALKVKQKAAKDKGEKEVLKSEILAISKAKSEALNAAKAKLQATLGTSQQNTTYRKYFATLIQLPRHQFH